MKTHDTVTVTFPRAEYEALVDHLLMHPTPRDEAAFPTLRGQDLRFAILTLEAAGRRPKVA